MTERFLFRGKRIDNGKWVEGFYLNHRDIAHYIIPTKLGGYVTLNEKDFAVPEWHEVDPATVGQCAGLRDRNGRLIFEGDILILDNKYHPNQGYESTIAVIWDKVGFCYRYPKAKDLRYTPSLNTNTTFHIEEYEIGKFAEIIGNVHDNPELLEA